MIVCPKKLVPVMRLLTDTDSLICATEERNNSLVVSAACNCATAIIDGTVNASICQWLLGVGIRSFLSSNDPRRLHSSWRKVSVSLDHKHYGGVTDSVHRFTYYTLSTCVVKNAVDRLRHERDAYTILDDGIWCYNKRRKPKETRIIPLRVVNVGSNKHPVIHIGGLLPCTNVFHCTILAPSIGLSKQMWGLRKLSLGEVYDALDLSQDLCDKVKNVRDLLGSSVIPVGLWSVAANMFLPITDRVVSTLPHDNTRAKKRMRITSYAPVPLGTHEKSIFTDILSNQEEQSAVKADDAEVNLNIWLQHYLDGGVLVLVLVLARGVLGVVPPIQPLQLPPLIKN